MHRLTGRSYSKASGSPTYPSSQGPDSFAYDRTGRMTNADRDYSSPYTKIELALAYDKANRVTSVAENAGTSYTVGYTYVVNTSNDYRDVSYPDGRVIREANDLRGRVDTIVDRGAGGTGTPVTLADNAYDLNNRQTSRAFPNYVTAGWTYDDAGRVSGVAHTYSPPPYTSATFLVMLGYGRDDVGNPLYREDAVESSHSEKYWYDDANRLTQFKRGTLNSGKTDIASTDYTTDANLTQKNVWTLDKLGNWGAFLKRNNGTEITEPRTNNTANEYLTIDPDGSGGASPLTLAHDGNGNLTDDGPYKYQYDIENRMTRVTLKSGSVLLADYHYDALGRRIRKIIPSGTDAGTWTYVVNELWQVVSEYKTVSSTTTHQKRFVHAGRSGYVDDHVAMWDIPAGPKIFYYHADAQFCTVAMTSDTGSVAERYVTDPYGKTVTYTSAWGTPQATSRIGNSFMHQGLWLDGECGKLQNRRRDYLPILGGFAQRDPLLYSDGPGLYGAYYQDPTRNLDPSGTMARRLWPGLIELDDGMIVFAPDPPPPPFVPHCWPEESNPMGTSPCVEIARTPSRSRCPDAGLSGGPVFCDYVTKQCPYMTVPVIWCEVAPGVVQFGGFTEGPAHEWNEEVSGIDCSNCGMRS